jgi:hypothetical protein
MGKHHALDLAAGRCSSPTDPATPEGRCRRAAREEDDEIGPATSVMAIAAPRTRRGAASALPAYLPGGMAANATTSRPSGSWSRRSSVRVVAIGIGSRVS